MKLEIVITENINEECKSMTCYEATEQIRKTLCSCKHTCGI
jgi:hypothetical protein